MLVSDGPELHWGCPVFSLPWQFVRSCCVVRHVLDPVMGRIMTRSIKTLLMSIMLTPLLKDSSSFCMQLPANPQPQTHAEMSQLTVCSVPKGPIWSGNTISLSTILRSTLPLSCQWSSTFQTLSYKVSGWFEIIAM